MKKIIFRILAGGFSLLLLRGASRKKIVMLLAAFFLFTTVAGGGLVLWGAFSAFNHIAKSVRGVSGKRAAAAFSTPITTEECLNALSSAMNPTRLLTVSIDTQVRGLQAACRQINESSPGHKKQI